VYGKIREGMSLQQVQALLGCPPGFYGDGSGTRTFWVKAGVPEALDSSSVREWANDTCRILVLVDEHSAVRGKLFLEAEPPPYEGTFLDRLRAWLGR
jgi:hypothetical protein